MKTATFAFVSIVGFSVGAYFYFTRNEYTPPRAQVDVLPAAGSATRPPADGTSRPAPPVASASLPALQSHSWDGAYAKSVSANDFIRSAAPSALAGDGRASYFVAEVLKRCAGITAELANSTPEQELVAREAQLAKVAALSASDRETILSRSRQRYQYCGAMIGENVFDGLPKKNSNYQTAKFWTDLAYQAGDALALADHAAEDAQNPKIALDPTSPASRDALSRAQSDLFRAMEKSTPEAIFQAQKLFVPPELQSIQHQDSVLMLAACDLGYDCTSANPRLAAIFECTTHGSCPPGFGIEDFVKQYLGPNAAASFPGIEASARILADAVRKGDQLEIKRFVTIRR